MVFQYFTGMREGATKSNSHNLCPLFKTELQLNSDNLCKTINHYGNAFLWSSQMLIRVHEPQYYQEQ